MTTEEAKIVPIKERMQTVRDLLKKYQPQMTEALPLHRRQDAERMARIVLTEIARTPRLLECTPASLIGAVLQAAAFGLDPGIMGDCWLIPYRNNRKGGIYECQYQTGYKGLLKLCRRSGDVGPVQARIVREKDHFRYSFGLSPKLEHIPSEDEEAGDIKYIYVVMHLKDGTAMFDVWTRGQIEAHRKKYSRAADEGPWVTAWEEMAKKTVLIRVCKLAPASVELQTAIALEELAETGQPQGLETLVEPDEAEVQQTKADKLRDELKKKREVSDVAPNHTTTPISNDIYHLSQAGFHSLREGTIVPVTQITSSVSPPPPRIDKTLSSPGDTSIKMGMSRHAMETFPESLATPDSSEPEVPTVEEVMPLIERSKLVGLIQEHMATLKLKPHYQAFLWTQHGGDAKTATKVQLETFQTYLQGLVEKKGKRRGL